MSTLSEHTKQELYKALEGKQSGAFIINDRLVSFEVESNEGLDNTPRIDLSQEIEENTELKESLSRYLNNPEMKRYTMDELKGKRHCQEVNGNE